MIKRDLYYERIPTKSLREDVRFLGNSLGNVIKEQEGKNFYNLVEKIRKLSKANKIQKCKVITRIHPLFYKITEGNNLEYDSGLKVFENLEKKIYSCIDNLN